MYSPRVLLQDGNLVFISAAHKNISFLSPFGHVLVNGIDLTDLLQAAHLLHSDQNLNLNKNSEQSEKENYFSVKNDLKKAQSTINEMLNNGKIRPFRVYKTITEFRKVKSQLNKLVKVSDLKKGNTNCKNNKKNNHFLNYFRFLQKMNAKLILVKMEEHALIPMILIFAIALMDGRENHVLKT